MKKPLKFIVALFVLSTPTLQVLGAETKGEQFKRELLSQIKKEIKDLSDTEIRAIINAVEANINEYVGHYEATDGSTLLTKDEKIIADQSAAGLLQQPFGVLQKEPTVDNVARAQLDAKITAVETKLTAEQPEMTTFANPISRLWRIRDARKTMDSETMRWELLEKGDVLVDLDNGKLGFQWGHVGMMYDKAETPEESRTIEILGFGDVVQFKNYKTTWHDNKVDRISHNYAWRVMDTDAPDKAAEAATKWIGKGYSLWPVLGDTSAFYCTELVFMAYREQGVDLGNGMGMGSWGILMPKSMYCSPELSTYYRQNMSGSAGKVC